MLITDQCHQLLNTTSPTVITSLSSIFSYLKESSKWMLWMLLCGSMGVFKIKLCRINILCVIKSQYITSYHYITLYNMTYHDIT